jgi:hypothetical protein
MVTQRRSVILGDGIDCSLGCFVSPHTLSQTILMLYPCLIFRAFQVMVEFVSWRAHLC